MRRGGRGSNLRGPWRSRDDESALYFNRWWSMHNCACVTVLAACSMAISILTWSSQTSRVDVRNLGIVFPLYHYHIHFQNGSHGMGGRAKPWRIGNRRQIQSKEHSNVQMHVFGGHRQNHNDMEHFYIEMKLGVPPGKYNFHIDTGSAGTWIYCIIPHIESQISDWGPNGLFTPEDNSYIKCVGKTATSCQQFQASCSGIKPCNRDDDYQCEFVAHYADNSNYVGLVVNETIILMLEDKSERKMTGLLGCVVGKERTYPELLPLMTDGLIGLGNCKGTLLDQWITNKAVKHGVLVVCLKKRVEWTMLSSPAMPVGYISMGMDFKEKFDQRNLVWSKLLDPGKMIMCAFAANLLFISFDKKDMVFGSIMLFDTGSDLTYLARDAYVPLLLALDNYATSRGYLRVVDNDAYVSDEQRVCWNPPANILAKASPICDFPPLTFAFEGMSRASIQYLIVQPTNYLVWNAHETKLCVNILQDEVHSLSNLGADLMREHLFIYDIENQRVRWQANSCELT